MAGGSYEEVPMGIFEVSEANRKAKCLEIKAYDYMVRFEKAFNGFEAIGNAFDFMNLCASACKVELAQTRADIEAMPNGMENLSIYTDNAIETFRDVLFYVGQVLGGFFVINRLGQLELKKYGNQPVLTVERRHRFTSSFSDFITRYTAVSSTNLRTQIAEYYALDPDDGLTMNLGVNPLLQFGLDETREQLVRNILADLSVVNYVPFDSDTIGNPALDVGDILSFSGGQADATKYACITSNGIKIGGRQTIKCVGKNPKLSQAKSKNDKNISGLLNQIEAGRIGIHTFTNASTFTVADVDTKIISIQFATSEDNHAQFFGQVIVDVSAELVTRSAEASGQLVIPSVNVDEIPAEELAGEAGEGNAEAPVVIGATEEQTLTLDSKNSTLIVNPEEAEIVRIIFSKYINEGFGAERICDYLNQHGYTKKKLKKNELNYFARSFIMKILDNPVYIGKIAYGRSVTEKVKGSRDEYKRVRADDYMLVDGMHEAIVDQETWEATRLRSFLVENYGVGLMKCWSVLMHCKQMDCYSSISMSLT